MKAFIDKFIILKELGINFQFVLDIGAYRGDFTRAIHTVWPTAKVWQFEADERNYDYIPHAIFSVLGDEEKDVEFHTLGSDKITTGSSIFLEQTKHYNQKSRITLEKRMRPLDFFTGSVSYFGDWRKYGLVKIDTQGSELLILKGAQKFLAEKDPQFILLECSITQYNLGAPLLPEVLEYMDGIGYKIFDFLDFSHDLTGQVIQTDILFRRKV